jgi:hypothetical protein
MISKEQVMSEDAKQNAGAAQEPLADGDDAAPVATVASGVLGAFFDELEKSKNLEETAGKMRALVLGQGIMAEPAVRAALFPEAS